MDERPSKTEHTVPQQVNGEANVMGDQVNVTIAEVNVQSDEEKQIAYKEALKKYEQELEAVKELRKELLNTFQKSQDTFETQLSYIAAGALGLSVGFIKDIVTPLNEAEYRWMMVVGWGALIATLLVNLISHILAARYAKIGAHETADETTYEPARIDKRSGRVEWINWVTIGTLTSGIFMIVLFIVLNALYGKTDNEQGSKKSATDQIKTDTSVSRGITPPAVVLTDTTKKR